MRYLDKYNVVMVAEPYPSVYSGNKNTHASIETAPAALIVSLCFSLLLAFVTGIRMLRSLCLFEKCDCSHSPCLCLDPDGC